MGNPSEHIAILACTLADTQHAQRKKNCAGEITRFVPQGVVMRSGEVLPAELVIYATGEHSTPRMSCLAYFATKA